MPLDFGGLDLSITYEAYTSLKKYLGLDWKGEDYDTLKVMTSIDERILKKIRIDFRRVSLARPMSWKLIQHADNSIEDEWGIRWKKVGIYNEMIDHPLKDMEDTSQVDDCNWPDPKTYVVDGLERKAEELQDSGWAVATQTIGAGIFEQACWLRGFERLLKDMYLHPRFVHAICDKVLEIQIGLFDRFLGSVGDHVQMVMTSDDLGMQTGMLISPKFYQKFIKPRHRKLYNFIHKMTDAKVFLHCCGSIEPVIDDLIEVGIDVLNPVQPKAVGMNSELLKKKYGSRLCFHGGVDTQEVLPLGTPDDVKEEVKRRINAFAPGGGYIVAPSHNIQVDVKPENVVVLYQTAYKYGKYA